MQELANLIRSRASVIAVRTKEESRALRVIADVAVRQSKLVLGWTLATGFHSISPDGTPYTSGKPNDPKQPLQYDLTPTAPIDPATDMFQALVDIQKAARGGGKPPKQVYVLRGVEAMLADPMVQRGLADVASELVRSGTTIILVDANVPIPTSLESVVAQVDLPLPTVHEITDLLADAEQMCDQAGIPVELTEHDRGEVIAALRGLTEPAIRQVVRLGVFQERRLGPTIIGHILAGKQAIIKQSGVLEYFDASSTVVQVGGLPYLQAYVRDVHHAMTPEAAAAGIDRPRGTMLVGIPGTGKSLTARAFANGRIPLLRLDFGSLFTSALGGSESNLRDVFRLVSAVGSCILWIDEIEKQLGSRSGELDGGTSQRMLGTLLTWMQEQQDAYIVVTANDVSSLRPELLRRFDDIFFVDVPDANERASILAIHLERRAYVPDDATRARIVEALTGYTGAEIEKVVRKAHQRAFAERAPLDGERILDTIPFVSPITRVRGQEMASWRQWAAESGVLPASPSQTYLLPGKPAGPVQEAPSTPDDDEPSFRF